MDLSQHGSQCSSLQAVWPSSLEFCYFFYSLLRLLANRFYPFPTSTDSLLKTCKNSMHISSRMFPVYLPKIKSGRILKLWKLCQMWRSGFISFWRSLYTFAMVEWQLSVLTSSKALVIHLSEVWFYKWVPFLTFFYSPSRLTWTSHPLLSFLRLLVELRLASLSTLRRLLLGRFRTRELWCFASLVCRWWLEQSWFGKEIGQIEPFLWLATTFSRFLELHSWCFSLSPPQTSLARQSKRSQTVWSSLAIVLVSTFQLAPFQLKCSSLT